MGLVKLGCLLIISIYSITGWGLTLNLPQAITYALANNIELQQSYLDQILLAHECANIKTEQFGPQLGVNLNLVNNNYQNEQITQQETNLQIYPNLRVRSSYGTEVSIMLDNRLGSDAYKHHDKQSIKLIMEQPLFKGRAKQVNMWPVSQKLLAKQVLDLSIKIQIENLIYEVMLKYFSALLAEQNYQIKLNYHKKANNLLKETQVKIQAGQLATTDLAKARLQVLRSKRDLSAARLDKLNSQQDLFNSIGVELQNLTLSPLQEKDLSKPVKITKQTLNNAVEQDKQLQIYNLHKNHLQQFQSIVKDSHKLDVRLKGELNFGRYDIHDKYIQENFYFAPHSHYDSGYSAQLSVNVPISGTKKRYNEILATKIDLDKTELKIKKYKNNLQRKIKLSHEKSLVQYEQLIIAQNSYKLAKQDYNSQYKKFDYGRVGLSEVINARDTVVESQVDYLRARQIYFQSLLDIKLIQGDIASQWEIIVG